LFVLDDPQRVPSTEEDVTVVLKCEEPSEDLCDGAEPEEDCTTTNATRSVYYKSAVGETNAAGIYIYI